MNDRLNQVTADTLVVGVDIASQEHFARAFDWRGFEFSKRAFKFGNTNVGFLSFLRWLEETQGKNGMKKYCRMRPHRLLLAGISEVPARPFTCNSKSLQCKEV